MSNIKTIFPSHSTYLFLPGPVGQLELLVSINSATENNDLIAVICHPHPLHGGTMDNKVVHTIHKALDRAGFDTIRFNYRGVGRSAGTYGDSVGELDDLMVIIAWLKLHKPHAKILLAGFSFGAFIALKASKQINCLYLISVAPAVQNQNYDLYMPVKCPWLVIQGEKDEIVAPELVFNWIEKLDTLPQLVKMPEASHFFHGCLIELREILENTISNYLQQPIQKN